MTEAERESYARANGHPPSAHGIVCVDFDGTIAPFGDLYGFPEPLPGAVEFIAELNEQGYKVIVFTSRLSQFWHESEGRDPTVGMAEQYVYISKYCEQYGLTVHGITAEKVPAIAYLDDKAIQFLDWKQASRSFFGGQD